MPGPAFIEGDTVTLRPIESDDYGFLQRNRNDPAIRRPLTLESPESREETEDAFERYRKGDGVGLLAWVDGERVGRIAVYDVDWQVDSAEVVYWIAPTHQGNGYATETLALTADYAFADLGLHRLRARVLARNEGSRQVLETVGFQREGRLRESKVYDGEYVDTLVYGLLEDDRRQ
jgi:RimJ/RimL family protein N-acetyltransferase